MCSESGQATVEWVGLVLMVALALGALTGPRAPSGERGLGERVAKRIACAAKGVGAPRAATEGCALPEAAAPPRRGVPLRRGVPPRSGVSPRAPVSRARAADAFQRLRGLGDVARRVWIVCLGYRRFLYELERPRMPGEAMSVEEALDVANQCINPYNFLGSN